MPVNVTEGFRRLALVFGLLGLVAGLIVATVEAFPAAAEFQKYSRLNKLKNDFNIRSIYRVRDAENAGVPDDEIDRRVHQALTFVELDSTFYFFPVSLSGGMKRRVAIARALIHQPELILYDSPTGGLDPITSTTIIELVMKERDFFRIPSLLVTHRLQDAFTLCSHHFDPGLGRMVPLAKGETDPNTTFLMLEEGRLIFDGSIRELVQSQDPFVKEFIE